MKWIILIILLAALALLAWVRLAPDEEARWHVLPETVEDKDLEGGVMRRAPGDLAVLDEIIRTEPRTTVLAGSVAEGMITYVTRSRVFGFPDYTTVAQRGDDVVIHARLRYGKSDMGVNRARVERWLATLRQR